MYVHLLLPVLRGLLVASSCHVRDSFSRTFILFFASFFSQQLFFISFSPSFSSSSSLSGRGAFLLLLLSRRDSQTPR